MAGKATVTVKVVGDASSLKLAFRDAESAATRFAQGAEKVGGQMQTWGRGLTRNVTLPLAGVGIAAFKMAADVQDNLGATEQIYRSSADTVKKWANDLDSYYGIAEGEALAYANMMGSLLQNLGGLTEDEAARQSAALVELAGDLTAMFGGSTQDAVRALTGALKGNNAMLDNYGIAVTDATIKQRAMEMGLHAGSGALTQQAKQAATLSLIMEQTSAAQGQAAREAEGASGAWRSFTTDLKNTAAEIGTHLLPAGAKLLSWGSDMASVFGSLPAEVQVGVVAFGALAASIGPILFVGGKLVTWAGQAVGAFRATVSAIETMRIRSMYLSQALGPMGMAGAAGVAIGAVGVLTLAYQHHQREAAKAEARNKAFADSIREVGDATDGTTKALDGMVEAGEGVPDVVLDAMRAAGRTTEDLADAIHGTNDEWNAFVGDVRGAFEEDQPDNIATRMGLTNLDRHLTTLRDSARGAAEQVDQANEVLSEQADTTGELGDATADTAGEIDEFTDQVDEAIKAVDAWERATNDMIDAAFRSDRANRDWQAGLDELADQVSDHGRSLDEDSEAGRRNQQTIEDLVAAGSRRIQALAAEGASTEDLTLAKFLMVEQLREELRQLGFNEEQIARYTEHLDAVPTDVLTAIDADTAGASLAVGSFLWELGRVPSRVSTVLDVDVSQAQASLDAINRALSGTGRSLGSLLHQGRADGGPVTAGTPYIVGERGPEMFVPKVSGTIVPNNQLAGLSGGSAVPFAGGGETVQLMREIRDLLAGGGGLTLVAPNYVGSHDELRREFEWMARADRARAVAPGVR